MADAPTPTPQGAEDDTFTFASTAQKDYPLCPEGPAQAEVTRALFSMKKKNPRYLKPGQDPNKLYPHVSLMLKTDKEYEMDGEKKPHNIFYGMNISDHKQSTMFAFFADALGLTPVPLNDKKQIAIKPPVKEQTEDGVDRMHMDQFKGLKFGILVKHVEGDDGKTRDVADSIFSTPEQKAMNAKLFLA